MRVAEGRRRSLPVLCVRGAGAVAWRSIPGVHFSMTPEMEPRSLHDSLLNAANVYAEAVHQAKHLDRANSLMQSAIKAEVSSLVDAGTDPSTALRTTTDAFKSEALDQINFNFYFLPDTETTQSAWYFLVVQVARVMFLLETEQAPCSSPIKKEDTEKKKTTSLGADTEEAPRPKP